MKKIFFCILSLAAAFTVSFSAYAYNEATSLYNINEQAEEASPTAEKTTAAEPPVEVPPETKTTATEPAPTTTEPPPIVTDPPVTTTKAPQIVIVTEPEKTTVTTAEVTTTTKDNTEAETTTTDADITTDNTEITTSAHSESTSGTESTVIVPPVNPDDPDNRIDFV